MGPAGGTVFRRLVVLTIGGTSNNQTVFINNEGKNDTVVTGNVPAGGTVFRRLVGLTIGGTNNQTVSLLPAGIINAATVALVGSALTVVALLFAGVRYMNRKRAQLSQSQEIPAQQTLTVATQEAIV